MALSEKQEPVCKYSQSFFTRRSCAVKSVTIYWTHDCNTAKNQPESPDAGRAVEIDPRPSERERRYDCGSNWHHPGTASGLGLGTRLEMDSGRTLGEGMIDKFWQWLAFRLPRRLAYWAAIRVGAYATSGPQYGTTVVPELTYMEALRRWDDQSALASGVSPSAHAIRLSRGERV